MGTKFLSEFGSNGWFSCPLGPYKLGIIKSSAGIEIGLVIGVKYVFFIILLFRIKWINN